MLAVVEKLRFMGGIFTAADSGGLLHLKIGATLDRFAENYLLWEGCHGTAEETLFLKQTEERFFKK